MIALIIDGVIAYRGLLEASADWLPHLYVLGYTVRASRRSSRPVLGLALNADLEWELPEEAADGPAT